MSSAASAARANSRFGAVLFPFRYSPFFIALCIVYPCSTLIHLDATSSEGAHSLGWFSIFLNLWCQDLEAPPEVQNEVNEPSAHFELAFAFAYCHCSCDDLIFLLEEVLLSILQFIPFSSASLVRWRLQIIIVEIDDAVQAWRINYLITFGFCIFLWRLNLHEKFELEMMSGWIKALDIEAVCFKVDETRSCYLSAKTIWFEVRSTCIVVLMCISYRYRVT